MHVPDLLARPSPSEWRAFAEAWVELTRARIAMSRGRMPAAPDIADLTADPRVIDQVQRALARADRLFGGDTKCLPVALAARAMLARRGVESALHMGTARTENPDTDRFHAWLKVGDRFVTGRCDESDYAPFQGSVRRPFDARPLEAVARECQRSRS